jgi:hypothetical protein
MVQLSRHPKQSAEQLDALQKWLESETATIMYHEGLTPANKAKYREQLHKAYRNRWELAYNDVRKDLAEWRDVFRSRAESAARTPTSEVARRRT